MVFDFMTKTETKHCTKCQTDKELTEFNRNKSTKDGLQHYCKPCGRASQKDWRKRNPEKVNDPAYSKEWREANKEHVAAYHKQWREENPEQLADYGKKWRDANREHINAKDRERYANDAGYRFAQSMRSSMHSIIKGGGDFGKNLDYLGCGPQEFRDHIASTFKPGMTLENHGEWHIDHRYPISSFDLTNEEEKVACFHYSNCQALWAIENHKKGATIPTESTHE